MTIDTIWYTRCPVPTAFSVAVSLGWLDEEFARDGIRVRSLASSRDPAVRQSHFEHTQANSVRHGGAIPPLVTRSRGRDLRIVGLSRSWSRQVVLALPGSEIRSASDLVGKRVAIPRRLNDPIDFYRATALRGFKLVLEPLGLSLDDVVPVEICTERSFVDDSTESTGNTNSLWDSRAAFQFQRDGIGALNRGEVDAIFAQGAGGVLAQAFLGAQIVAEVPYSEDVTRWVNNQPYPLTLSGGLTREYPVLAARLVARVIDAAAWARENEVATKRIIATETGLPEELVDLAFGPQVHEQLDLNLSPENIAGLQSIHDELLAHDFIAGPLDIEGFIDPAPLAAARSFVRADALASVAAE